jgi:hypothetical protein
MSEVWGFRDLVPERAANLQPLGFTERQARFLVTVMLHSGVFLERQYCRFVNLQRIGVLDVQHPASVIGFRFGRRVQDERTHGDDAA